MRRLALSALLMAGLLSVSVSAVAWADAGGTSLDARAERLVNVQVGLLEQRDPRCRPSQSAVRTPPVADVPVGPQVTAALGVFRRPATDAERAAAEEASMGPFGGVLPHDGVRLVTAADGTVVRLITVVDIPRWSLSRAAYDRCHEIVDRRLRAKARRGDHVARRAVRLHARRSRAERPAAKPLSVELLLVGIGDGFGGDRFESKRFARHGASFCSGPADARRGGSLRVALVVPDGVTAIRATFPAVSPRGAHRKPVRYPSAVTVEVPVTDNVAAFAVARGVDDFGSATFAWLAADGSVIHTVGG